MDEHKAALFRLADGKSISGYRFTNEHWREGKRIAGLARNSPIMFWGGTHYRPWSEH